MKDFEKSVRGLELMGMIAGILLILAAVGVFFSGAFAPHFMTLAVGCGIVVNIVLTVLTFLKRQPVRGVFFLVLALMLTAVFIMQILILEG